VCRGSTGERACQRWVSSDRSEMQWLPQTRFVSLLLLFSLSGAVKAQLTPAKSNENSSMHQHFDAAYRFQSSGDLARAEVEHARFLVEALDHIANFHTDTGHYEHAAPRYDEALTLEPTDFGLLMDYAGASLDAHDPNRAKSLLQVAGNLDTKSTTARQKPEVHRLLGSAFRHWAIQRLDQCEGIPSIMPR
jgi:hypothetical protein